MTLTKDEASKVLEAVTTLLQQQGARQILDGIDESRRLSVEEELPQQKSSELKQVARARRRPPNNSEMLHIVLELLYQRLIVLPRIGAALKTRLASENYSGVSTPNLCLQTDYQSRDSPIFCLMESRRS
jgi:hypothetical protein